MHAAPPDLGTSERLSALYLHAAVRRLGAGALGIIDLPPLSEGRLEPGQLRVGATLYWCAQIERAGLLTAAEQLARRVRSGLPIGPTALARWNRFLRSREDHFTPEERQHLYTRLFDATFDEAFSRFGELLDAAAGDRHIDVHTRTRVSLVAQEVGQLVSGRAVGIAGFAAREILVDLRAAWGLFQDRELQALLGVTTGWEAVRVVSGRAGTVPPDRANLLAESGRSMLAWIADNAESLASGNATVTPDLLSAGTRWWMASR